MSRQEHDVDIGDFNAQIKEKFRANGGRVGGPFERMLGTLRMSDAERLPRPLG
jgi:hypothetical protein